MIDVIGVYDESFTPLFEDANYIKASVSDTSQLFTHPLERGNSIADYKIDNPIEINLQIMLLGSSYKNTYKALKKIKTDSSVLTIQTRTEVYNSMYIIALPYEEDNTISEGIKLVVSLKQATFENTNTRRTEIDPRYARDANTIDKGNVQGGEVDPNKRQSVLASLL